MEGKARLGQGSRLTNFYKRFVKSNPEIEITEPRNLTQKSKGFVKSKRCLQGRGRGDDRAVAGRRIWRAGLENFLKEDGGLEGKRMKVWLRKASLNEDAIGVDSTNRSGLDEPTERKRRMTSGGRGEAERFGGGGDRGGREERGGGGGAEAGR
ncbi:hypothetical protein Droror1_Dr00023390 [Drosera rotundifolia]